MALLGNEPDPPTGAHHGAQSPPPAHAAQKETAVEHPAESDHSEAKNGASSAQEHAAEHDAEAHPQNHAVATESGHAPAPEGKSEKPSTGHDKKRSAKHELPPPPQRPKGVLCGSLPAKKLVWKAKQGPISLVGTVVIGPGAELDIGSGSEIRIGGYDSCPDSGATASNGRSIALVVRGGKLRLNGKAGKPVRFTLPASGTGYLWNGIRVEKAARDEDAQLRWIELSRATKGLSFLASAGKVEHAVVEDCGIGIASLLGASPTISHSVISRSGVAAIASNRSATRVVSSLILEGGDGIRFDGIGLSSIATSCFWGQTGTEIVRGPAGVGTWKGDSIPDRFGNWHRDPVLRDSPEHQSRLAQARQRMETQPWWKPRRLPDAPSGQGRWSLSPFSPLIDKGESRFCSDPDGTKCDIGLWGGP